MWKTRRDSSWVTSTIEFSKVRSNKLFVLLPGNSLQPRRNVRYHKLKTYLRNIMAKGDDKSSVVAEHSKTRNNAAESFLQDLPPVKRLRTTEDAPTSRGITAEIPSSSKLLYITSESSSSAQQSGSPSVSSNAQEIATQDISVKISEALEQHAPTLFREQPEKKQSETKRSAKQSGGKNKSAKQSGTNRPERNKSRKEQVVDSLVRLEHSIGNADNFVCCTSKRAFFTMLELVHHWSNHSKQLLDLFVSVEGFKYLDNVSLHTLMFKIVGPETKSLIIRQKHKKYHAYFTDICESAWIRCEPHVVSMIERAEKLPNHVEEGFASLPERVKLLVGPSQPRRDLLSKELAKYGLTIRPNSTRCSLYINGNVPHSVHRVVAVDRVGTVLFARSRKLWGRRNDVEEANLDKCVLNEKLTWSEACDKVIKDIKASSEYLEAISDHYRPPRHHNAYRYYSDYNSDYSGEPDEYSDSDAELEAELSHYL